MVPRILVVAQRGSILNKFEQESLQNAYNMKDFLEGTNDYSEVSIFQLASTNGDLKEWVRLGELEN